MAVTSSVERAGADTTAGRLSATKFNDDNAPLRFRIARRPASGHDALDRARSAERSGARQPERRPAAARRHHAQRVGEVRRQW